MLKRILLGLATVVIVGLGCFAALAWRSPISPIAPPAKASFSPMLITRGEVLAGAGYCATCHTTKGGKPYAGGYAMNTGFGTIYSTNITPDPETGIGTWSEEAFRRAMHDGVARDGTHLFPAFPYDHFTKLTDEDVSALYAYFMTREPVRASAPGQYGALSAEHPRLAGGVEAPLLPAWPIRQPSGPWAGMESGAPIWPKASAIAVPATRHATCWARKRAGTALPVL